MTSVDQPHNKQLNRAVETARQSARFSLRRLHMTRRFDANVSDWLSGRST